MKQVTQKFGLKSELSDLFPVITDVYPSEWLTKTLQLAKRMPLTNEKSKSERIVSPILLEIIMDYEANFTLFSGEELNISADDNLAGPCDFFITHQKPSIVFASPVISLVEAKDENLEWGVAQCAAQLYGASLFNQQEGNTLSVLYGCATTGVEWQFIKFENNTLYIDRQSVTALPQVLGTWHWIIRFFRDSYFGANK